MQRLTDIARSLRGTIDTNADPAPTIHEVADIVTMELESLRSLQEMYRNGDSEALASAIRSSIRDAGVLKGGTQEAEQIGGFDGLAAPRDFELSNLEHVTDDQLVQFYAPQQTDQIVQHMEEVIEQLRDTETFLSSLRRHRVLKQSDIFHHQDWNDDKSTRAGLDSFVLHSQGSKIPFHGGINWSKFDFATNIGQSTKSHVQSLPALDIFLHHGDQDSAHMRRLEAGEKHHRRTQALSNTCQPRCAPGDIDCISLKLIGCVDRMSDYDIALVFVRGYVETDKTKAMFASFSLSDVTKLLLFDSEDMMSKIWRIREKTASIRWYRKRNDLRAPKCPQSLQLSRDDCYSVAKDLGMPTNAMVGVWTDKPCGCFYLNPLQQVYYNEAAECRVHADVTEMFCKKDWYKMHTNLTKQKCPTSLGLSLEQCYLVAKDYGMPTNAMVGDWSDKPCGCFYLTSLNQVYYNQGAVCNPNSGVKGVFCKENLDPMSDFLSLLSEFHSSCDPARTSCSEPNPSSYQLSVDNVCNQVHTPSKLLFAAMFDKLDRAGSTSVGIRSHSGSYLSAWDDGSLALQPEHRSWERWTVERASQNQFSFKSHFSRYLSGSSPVTTSSVMGKNEIWTEALNYDGTVSLRSSSGQYLSAWPDIPYIRLVGQLKDNERWSYSPSKSENQRKMYFNFYIL